MKAARGKTKIKNLLFLIISSAVLIACSPATKSFSFDSDTWKNDLSGCLGKRLAMKNQVESSRLKILQMKERELRPILGKPDAEELLERSNKIYIYYLTPGPKCQGTQKEGPVITWAIRFDALGTVRESNLITE